MYLRLILIVIFETAYHILSPRYYNNSYFPRAPTFFVVVESTIVIQREIARISFPLRSKCTLTRGSEGNIEKKTAHRAEGGGEYKKKIIKISV